jgi:hypothetical protein
VHGKCDKTFRGETYISLKSAVVSSVLTLNCTDFIISRSHQATDVSFLERPSKNKEFWKELIKSILLSNRVLVL